MACTTWILAHKMNFYIVNIKIDTINMKMNQNILKFHKISTPKIYITSLFAVLCYMAPNCIICRSRWHVLHVLLCTNIHHSLLTDTTSTTYGCYVSDPDNSSPLVWSSRQPPYNNNTQIYIWQMCDKSVIYKLQYNTNQHNQTL